MVARSVLGLGRCAIGASAIEQIRPARWEGRITATSGRMSEISGLARHLSLGARLALHTPHGVATLAEIVSLYGDAAGALMFFPSDGLRIGSLASAVVDPRGEGLAVSDAWLGRVIDALGRPIDGGPALPSGPRVRSVRTAPPEATRRARLGRRISLGVRSLDLFTTCRSGQRLGLFAAAGVGKSTLLSMLARSANCDVTVISLVGERGREVRDFLEDDLGHAGLAKSVVVVATSDASPLMRREAALAAMTVAEHFRDNGKNVLFLMDSVTRYCHALREIAVAAGEAPLSRGYPPSVFAELPRFLERAGPGAESDGGSGHITALFTVLVDGDDHNEPVADSMRGLLDGHVVLDRRIAEHGRFPAVDVGRSLSRTVPGCNDAVENAMTSRARSILTTYADAVEIVRLGAYHAGTDARVDESLILAPRLEQLLCQGRDERSELAESFARLRLVLDSAR